MGDWDLQPPAKNSSTANRRQAAGHPAGPPDCTSSPEGTPAGPAAVETSPPAPPPPAGRREGLGSRRFYPWLAAAAALLLIGILAGFYIGRAQYAGDSTTLAATRATVGELKAALAASEDRNWTYYRLNQVLQERLQESSSPTTMPPGNGSRTTFSDGVYLVGEDIPPGQYDGVVSGSTGYWARLKGTDGAIASIIENGIPRGAFVLTIMPGDTALELRGVTLTLR